MPRNPCLTCGTPTDAGPRCPAHAVRRGSDRRTTTERGLGAAHQRLAKRVLARWRAEHGDWCPGWGRPPHAASDLSLDHVVARSEGGRSVEENAAVLCIGCNVRKGGRNRRRRG